MNITIPGKQHIVGIDNIEDASDYNQYDDVPLFTDLPNRIKLIEATLDEEKFSSMRKDGVAKIVKHLVHMLLCTTCFVNERIKLMVFAN
jgi:hypothetical protein